MGGLVDGYSHYSNDVSRYEDPELIEISANVREFDERRLSFSKFGQGNQAAQERKNETTNQIAPIKETSSADGVFFDANNFKQRQFEIIQETNPMWDDCPDCR